MSSIPLRSRPAQRRPPLPVVELAGSPPEDDLFRYGWRFVQKIGPDGKVEWEQVPLTLEDVLHPQEGDVIPATPLQHQDSEYLGPIFRERVKRIAGGWALVDCIVDWNVPGVRNHCPDHSIFGDLRKQPPLNKGTFRLAEWGGRCLLVVEIVSPSTRDNDVNIKVQEYWQAKVPLYVIVDLENDDETRRLLAYRTGPKGFLPIPLDKKGRILLDPLGLLLGLKDNRVVCYDARTGKQVGDWSQETTARKTAEKGKRKETAARVAADRRATRFEQLAREEAEARALADQRARDEAEARVLADQRARDEAEARVLADQRARDEAEARALAERRMKELEAEIRRLRGD